MCLERTEESLAAAVRDLDFGQRVLGVIDYNDRLTSRAGTRCNNQNPYEHDFTTSQISQAVRHSVLSFEHCRDRPARSAHIASLLRIIRRRSSSFVSFAFSVSSVSSVVESFAVDK